MTKRYTPDIARKRRTQKPKSKRCRSAKTGRFVSEKTAKRYPTTTVRESR